MANGIKYYKDQKMQKTSDMGPGLQNILRSSYNKIYLRIIIRQC